MLYSSNCQDSVTGLSFYREPALPQLNTSGESPPSVGLFPGTVLADVQARSAVEGFGFMDESFEDLTPSERKQADELLAKGIPLCAVRSFFRDHVKSRTATYQVVNAAIELGLLKRPPVCQKCHTAKPHKDGREPIQGHHDDYNKPLEVRWLCAKCHQGWHSRHKAIERGQVTPAELASAELRLAAARLESEQRLREMEGLEKEVRQLRARLSTLQTEHSR